MIIIKSLQNPYIKSLKKQMLKKNLLFLDSPKLIEEALKSRQQLFSLIIDYKKLDVLTKYDFVKKTKKNQILVESKIIKHFSKMKTPQGIVGIFEIKKNDLKLPNGNFLVLDSIQNAGNVGMLLRSAHGAGFNDVYLIDCAKVSNIKTIRSSMGSIFKINFYEISKKEFLNFFKQIPYPLYAADLNGKNVFNFNFQAPCGIVLGNEGNGLCDEIKNIITDVISIPIPKDLESLNVGVAGSIIMFQIKNFISNKKI